jgi:hypothetical protein
MAGYCKLMAQNWHKSFALVRACIGFFMVGQITVELPVKG